MLNFPDCWASPQYDKSYGPRSQWLALRNLFKGTRLSEEEEKWLHQTTLEEVDGKMVDLLTQWKEDHPEVPEEETDSVVAVSEPMAMQSTANVIGDLFADIGKEIAQIKSGALSPQKANEIAKFRTMQLRSMELVLQARHLEVKARKLEPRP